MKKSDVDGGRGQDGAVAQSVQEVTDRSGRRTDWDIMKWSRVGLRCESCGHTEEETGPNEGQELMARKDLVTHQEETPEGSQLVGVCPECSGTMGSFTPDYDAGLPPDAVEHVDGNVLLNEGIAILIALLCDIGAEQAYDNANAQLGAGNSSAAEDPTHTDLQGGSTAFAAMDVTYPQDNGSQGAVWKSTFGSGVGNFAWEEVSVRNSVGADENLNRKVGSLGSKSGGTWTLQLTITFA